MDRMATEDTGRKQAKERGFQRTPSCQHLRLKISSLQDCEEVESLFLLLLNLFKKKFILGCSGSWLL